MNFTVIRFPIQANFFTNCHLAAQRLTSIVLLKDCMTILFVSPKRSMNGHKGGTISPTLVRSQWHGSRTFGRLLHRRHHFACKTNNLRKCNTNQKRRVFTSKKWALPLQPTWLQVFNFYSTPQRVFTGKLVSPMQAAANQGNLQSTKAVTLRFLVEDHLCD